MYIVYGGKFSHAVPELTVAAFPDDCVSTRRESGAVQFSFRRPRP